MKFFGNLFNQFKKQRQAEIDDMCKTVNEDFPDKLSNPITEQIDGITTTAYTDSAALFLSLMNRNKDK